MISSRYLQNYHIKLQLLLQQNKFEEEKIKLLHVCELNNTSIALSITCTCII